LLIVTSYLVVAPSKTSLRRMYIAPSHIITDLTQGDKQYEDLKQKAWHGFSGHSKISLKRFLTTNNTFSKILLHKTLHCS